MGFRKEVILGFDNLDSRDCMSEVCTIVVILKVSEVPDFDGFEVWNLVAVLMV